MHKNVLITGATSDIGICLAKVFAKNGYNVVIHYHKNIDKALLLKKELEEVYHVSVLVCHADLASQDDVIELMKRVKEKFVTLDVVVHNAAFEQDEPIDEKTIDTFIYTFHVNVGGSFLISKYAKDLMDDGTFVFISSLDATKTFRPLSIDYCASKAALNSLCQTLAMAIPHIKSVSLMLPWIKTSSVLEMDPLYLKSELKRTKQKELVLPEEVAIKVLNIVEDKKIVSGTIMEMKKDE